MKHRVDHRLIRQILLFAAVAEESSIRQAAEKLNMSVPPLLAQINELEERLQIRLFDRSPRGIQLSSAGQSLMPSIEKFITHAEMLDYSIRQLKKGDEGIINIGANREGMLFWVPAFRRELKRTYPTITTFVKEIDSRDVEQELKEGTVNFAIGYFTSLGDSSLELLALKKEKPIAIMSTDHPLAQQETIQCADLKDEDFVLPARELSPKFFDAVIRLFEKDGGFSPRVTYQVGSSSRQICFTVCGQGIGILPESFKGWIPNNAVAKEISDAGCMLQLSLAWNPKILSEVRDKVLLFIKSHRQIFE